MTRRDAPRLFCFGLGYSAQALIRELGISDWYAGGTVRTEEKATELKKHGIDAVPWDGGELTKTVRTRLESATHVLVSVPPDENGDPVFRAAAEVIRSIWDLKWLGYLSTTGVYGDTGGAAVDETAPLNPSSARSQRRVDAESVWLRLLTDADVPVHIFRLAGIYGPGRSALDAVRAKRAKRIDKPGHAFSRIHVDDIGQILAASIGKPNSGAIYNVCDNEPAPPAEVTAYACDLLDVEPPPLEDFETAKQRMTPMGLSFWNDNRRVLNNKLRDELGVTLKYPDYRSGLNAVMAEEG